MDAVLEQSPPSSLTRARKITMADAEAIAEKVAKRITETGACLLLGINYLRWRQWKHRHKNSATFENIVSRIRESKIEQCLDSIDAAGNPTQVTTKNGTTYTRPGDWRAKAWLVERVHAPERFGDSQQPATSQLSEALNKSLSMLATVYADAREKRVLPAIESSQTLQLAEGKTCNVRPIGHDVSDVQDTGSPKV